MFPISPQEKFYSIEAIYKFLIFLYWLVFEQRLKKKLIDYSNVDKKIIFLIDNAMKVDLSKLGISIGAACAPDTTSKNDLLGMALFVSFTAEVDRIIDNENFNGYKTVEELKEKILQSNLIDNDENEILYENKKIKIKEYLEIVLNHFESKEKRDLIRKFLNEAAEAEFKLRNSKILKYKNGSVFEEKEIKNYIAQTSVKEIEVGIQLIDMPQRMRNSSIKGIWAVQMLDGIADAREDFRKGVPNDLITMLHKNKELDSYLKGSNYKISKSEFDKLIQSYTREIEPVAGRFILFFWRYFVWFRYS